MSSVPEERHPRESRAELESWATSEIVSDQTEAQIRILIAEGAKDAKLLDHEITQVQELLQRLLEKRIIELARLTSLRGAISSVKRLPLEILSKILNISWKGVETTIPPGQHAQILRFGNVCPRWRAAMWCARERWQNVWVHLPRHHRTQTDPEKIVRIGVMMEHTLFHTNALF